MIWHPADVRHGTRLLPLDEMETWRLSSIENHAIQIHIDGRTAICPMHNLVNVQWIVQQELHGDSGKLRILAPLTSQFF